MNCLSLTETKWFAWLISAAVFLADAQSAPAQPSPTSAQPAPDEAEPVRYPYMGKTRELMVGPDTWFRFGVQAQVWVNYQQSANRVMGDDGGYSYDVFLRRARLIASAQFFKNVHALILLDSPNLGRTTVTGTGEAQVVSKGFTPAIIQDAFVQLRVVGEAFMIEGGLMVIPFSHNGLQSTTGYLPLDVSNTAAVVAGTATSVLRDVGMQIKGYVLDERLEYRLGTFSGLRQGPNGDNPPAHNAPRVTGHLQYQFFDTEKGYVYSGYNFGKKKLVGLSAGFDFQKADDVGEDSTTAYKAFSAGVFGSWPISGHVDPNGGDEIDFNAEYYRYDGGTTFSAIPEQNDANVEIAYYRKSLNASAFARFEIQEMADDAAGAAGTAGNRRWFGGGFKYFVAENSLHFTLAYNRTQYPDADEDAVNSTNQLTLQMQAFYY